MVNRYFIAVWLVIICFTLKAQQGSFFLSNYSPPFEGIDFRSTDIKQDQNGEIYFAAKAGVLEFDGFNWNLVELSSAVYALSTKGDDVLVAGFKGVAKLSDHRRSPRTYQMIAASQGFFSTAQDQSNSYFCSKGELFAYSHSNQKILFTLKKSQSTGDFLGLYNVGDEILLKTQLGLFTCTSGSLKPYQSNFSNLIFSTISSKGRVLIGNDKNEIYIKDGNSVKQLELNQADLLEHFILVDGVWVNDDLIALGTLRGGVLFAQLSTGEIKGVVDYSSGLPDNEVYKLMTDRDNGVWVAHEYGFTRIAPNLPFRLYHHYPGLEGNVLCIQTFNNQLYVGTTMGLFVLRPEASSSSKINYRYNRISGIEGRINQLQLINDQLVASGIAGIYKIHDLTVNKLYDQPVQFVFNSSAAGKLLVSTGERVIAFDVSTPKWNELPFLNKRTGVSEIFEDRNNNVWLCAVSEVLKVETDNDSLRVSKYEIDNPMLDRTVGFSYGTNIYMVSSGQFRVFRNNTFENYDSISGGRPYFSAAGAFWFNDGLRWKTISRKFQGMRLEWLNVFPSIRYIIKDDKGNGLWLVTDKNEICRFLNDQDYRKEETYPLILKEVRGNEIQFAKKIEIEQTAGVFTFEFVQPDYLGKQSKQYRYRLTDMSNQWSAWSASNNVINFSYLPAGSYRLAVQSRDLLGQESVIEQIEFKVNQPYWKEWWFFALEFLLFSFLVSMSIRLARSDSRYRVLSQILTVLTVIILVQFIQTTVESIITTGSSPVMDFFIQVCIALLVLPVEIIARNTMQRAIQTKYQTEAVIDNLPE